jgi:hypothetical protein
MSLLGSFKMKSSEKLYSIGLHKSPDSSVDSVCELISGKEVYRLTGHDEPSRKDCGWWITTEVCMNLKDHAGFHFDKYGNMQDYTGLAYVKKRKNGCFSAGCRVCYRYKWARREARAIEHRLKEISKLLPKGNKKSGEIEHIIVSFPKSMWDLPFEVLCKKAVKGLENRLVSGGSLIFHAGRFWRGREASERGVKEGWHLGIHFHALAMIQGGYGCRGCKKSCKDGHCNGFKSRCYVEGMKDGLFVKVAVNEHGKAEKRKSVYASALYELRHAWYRKGMKRISVTRWFGTCSYRRAKVGKPVPKRSTCPLCDHYLTLGYRYIGSVDSPSGCFFAPVVEEGVDVIVPDARSCAWEVRSGSYEGLGD